MLFTCGTFLTTMGEVSNISPIIPAINEISSQNLYKADIVQRLFSTLLYYSILLHGIEIDIVHPAHGAFLRRLGANVLIAAHRANPGLHLLFGIVVSGHKSEGLSAVFLLKQCCNGCRFLKVTAGSLHTH